MSLEVGKKYVLIFEMGKHLLTYTATIVSVDEMFVTFTDKFGKDYSFRISNLISYNEAKDGEKE